MKKIITIITTTISLTFMSCDDSEQMKSDRMKSPVVVVAIDKIGHDCSHSGAIVLKDSSGKLYSFDCITDIARSVSNSRKVGDTLK